MTLTLTIENEASLANGAPTSVSLTDGRGVDIGRSSGVDWSLPDPTRFISGRHCEIRRRDGAYWLNDISTNGTFVNDSPRRVQSPHRLRDGDRVAIGSYVIRVALDEPEPEAIETPTPAPRAGTLWPSAQENAVEPGAEAPLDPVIARQVAEAIAVETAPPSGASFAEIVEARQAAEAAGKPFTMLRPRGFFPQPQGETAPPQIPPQSPPHEPAAPSEADLWADPGPASPSARAPQDDLWAAEPEPEGLSPEAPADAAQASETPPFADAPEAQAFEAPAEAPASGVQPPEPAPEPIAARPADPPPVPAAQEPAPSAQEPGAPSAEDFLKAFARGAGIPEHVFARRDPLKVGEEMGALMRRAVEDMTQLLKARSHAKGFARASSQTMIQAVDNNPLKFAPTPEDALKIMFGPRTAGYLDARRAFEAAFLDLKAHQISTYAAMRQAARMLVEDLDPREIEAEAGSDGALAALFGGRKARLWDVFLARWRAKSLRHEDGLVDAFMLYFSQCYDDAKEGG